MNNAILFSIYLYIFLISSENLYNLIVFYFFDKSLFIENLEELMKHINIE